LADFGKISDTKEAAMGDPLQKLLSEDKLLILRGLEELVRQLPGLGETEFEEAVQAVVGLFHIDPTDHPELLPVLDQAESVLADLRQQVIPSLIRCLADTDLKVHFHLASVFGRMGYAAVRPLLDAQSCAEDPYVRIFSLYALGKVKDRKILEALPALYAALDDENNEVRDTAARALGKVCEHVEPEQIGENLRGELFDRLLAKVSDRYAGVRSKAIRSLGKMARYGLLDEAQRQHLAVILGRVLGEDPAGNWDLAYVVRAEAQKARRHL
jgi:vesicle coat complex subunit